MACGLLAWFSHCTVHTYFRTTCFTQEIYSCICQFKIYFKSSMLVYVGSPMYSDAYTWELLKMNLRPAWATQWNSVSKYIDESLFKKKMVNCLGVPSECDKVYSAVVGWCVLSMSGWMLLVLFIFFCLICPVFWILWITVFLFSSVFCFISFEALRWSMQMFKDHDV